MVSAQLRVKLTFGRGTRRIPTRVSPWQLPKAIHPRTEAGSVSRIRGLVRIVAATTADTQLLCPESKRLHGGQKYDGEQEEYWNFVDPPVIDMTVRIGIPRKLHQPFPAGKMVCDQQHD